MTSVPHLAAICYIDKFPWDLFAVRVDKLLLREWLGSTANHEDMYRFTFNRLLEVLNDFLTSSEETGMLLMDSRSDIHNHVDDKRIVKAYQDWVKVRGIQAIKFVDIPWFGVSDFYTGLQLADYVYYLINRSLNQSPEGKQSEEFITSFHLIKPKLKLFEIP